MNEHYLQRIYLDVDGFEIPDSWGNFTCERFSMITLQSWDGLDFRLDFKGPEGKIATLEAMQFERDLLFISNIADHLELAESLGIAVLSIGQAAGKYRCSIEDLGKADAEYLEGVYRAQRDLI